MTENAPNEGIISYYSFSLPLVCEDGGERTVSLEG